MHDSDSQQSRQGAASQIRVVIVAPSLCGLIGGQEVQADLLLRNWQSDPAAYVSFVAKNLELPQWLERIPYLRTIVRFPLYLAALWAHLRKADVAHIFTAAGSSFLISTVPAYCVARLLRKKTVINYHSPRAHQHLNSSPFARIVLREADCVIVPSAYLVDIFRVFRIEARAVPNVMDFAQFQYRNRNPLQPFLLCSRNLESRYGIDLVLRAFAQVKAEFPNARLCLAGTGPETAAIRRLAAELNLNDIEMSGRVSRKEIGRLYDQSDIFINASRIDNMPISIMESFASGMPVATTNAGGIPFMVEHEQTGLLCDKEDWRSLAANVIRLLREPALATRITENAHRQSSGYSWKAIRDQWLEVYRCVTIPRSFRGNG